MKRHDIAIIEESIPKFMQNKPSLTALNATPPSLNKLIHGLALGVVDSSAWNKLLNDCARL